MLPSIQGSTEDHIYFIQGGLSIVSITYRKNHMPLPYTHLPSFKNILKSNVWEGMITLMQLRFNGFHEHIEYLDVLTALENDDRQKTKSFCSKFGCKSNKLHKRPLPMLNLSSQFIRDPNKRPDVHDLDIDIPRFIKR